MIRSIVTVLSCCSSFAFQSMNCIQPLLECKPMLNLIIFIPGIKDMSSLLDFRLQKIVLVSISSSLWQQFENEINGNDYNEKEWGRLMSRVLHRLENMEMPYKLKNELAHIVKFMGEETYKWNQYINNKFKRSNCLKMYWTPHGTINKMEILKYWKANCSFETDILFEIACEYCLAKLIKDLWLSLQEKKNSIILQNFTSIYWKCKLENSISNLETKLKYNITYKNGFVYQNNLSVNLNMFKLSVSEGYDYAVFYFWKKLTQNERSDCLGPCIRLALKRYTIESIMKHISMTYPGYVPIFLFLFENLKDHEKMSLLKEQSENVVNLLLDSWPCQELLLLILPDLWNQFQQNDFDKLIFKLTKKMELDMKLFRVIDQSQYQKLLFEIWKIAPSVFKYNMDQTGKSRMIVKNLLTLKDIYNLQTMIQYFEESKRLDLIFEIYTPMNILQLIKYDYDLFETFVTEQCNKKEFHFLKDKISRFSVDICYHFIEQSEFDLADKYLNWQYDNQETKFTFKKNLTKDYPFSKLLSKFGKHLNFLVKFTNWAFENKEDKKKFLNDFILSEKGVCYCYEYIRSSEIEKINYFIQFWFNSKTIKELFVKKFEEYCLKIKLTDSTDSKAIETFKIILNK